MSLSDLLSTAWNLFSKSFTLILMIVLIIYLPINIISALLSVDTVSINNSLNFSTDTNYTSGYASRAGLAFLLYFLAQTLAPLAIAYAINSLITGQKIDYQTALKKALSRWLPSLGTGLLGASLPKRKRPAKRSRSSGATLI